MNRQTLKYLTRHIYNAYNRVPANIPIQTNYLSNIDNDTLKQINKYRTHNVNIPVIINGKEYFENSIKQLCPYNYSDTVCTYNYATKELLNTAIKTTENSKSILRKLSVRDRQNIFDKLSDWISNKYKTEILASTIYGQGKTIHQAEIDAVCELADFLKFNSYFYNKLNIYQPYSINSGDIKNTSQWLPLNGFVASITPFNFTAIGGNLASAPALMGNYVIWKPSDNAILSNYIFYKAMLEAGMPPEAVSFIPCEPKMFLDNVCSSKNLGGIAFTGSSIVFDEIWKKIGNNISLYNNYPRIVGETGGMNFHFIFNDANIDNAVFSTIRGAFEYSGQKCSATSRIYIPKSLSKQFIDKLIKQSEQLIVDSPEINNVFTSAVINENAFNKITSVIDKNKDLLIYGGDYSNKVGYFINPSIFLCDNHNSELMNEELFGPTLCLYIYDDNNVEETLYKCSTNRYGLTGSIFTSSEFNVMLADKYLYNSCGNYYINDKSTGSIVFQQPFGGSRKSGTNDKAGSKNFLTRFGNNKIIKLNNCL